jgi:putative ABC transport system permease protein
MASQSLSLINNNLKIVARSFYKNKTYTLLNLLGLTIGFIVFIFAALYAYFETHYEQFNSNADHIYRVTHHYAPAGSEPTQWARVPTDYINELPNDFPAVKTLIRFQNHERKYVRIGNEKFRLAHTYVTDKEVFDVFDLKLIFGNAKEALAKPHSIVLTQSLAKKYFGIQDPIGKEIFVNSDFDNTEILHHVTGVMADLPANTHLPMDMLISFRDPTERSGWAYTYVLLHEGATISQVESGIRAFIKKHDTEEEAKNTGIHFQPLRDIHLTSHLAREIVPPGEMLYVRVVGFAGVLILVMAAINFMNLNSAMSLGRAKEFGMRKVMGASRRQLVYYLITESIVYHLVALLIAGGVAYLLFPYVQPVVTLQFLPDFFTFALILLAIVIVLGLLTGIYPVVLLTTLQPVAVLKTTKALSITGKESAFSLKRMMVTLQFGISVLLIGSAFIAYHQFQFLLNKNLGMQREQVIAIPGTPDPVKAKFETFRTRLAGQPGIVSVSACMEVPSREIRDAGPVLVEGINNDPNKAPRMDIQVTDYNFTSLLGLQLVAGKNIQAPAKPFSIPEFTDAYPFQKYLLEQPREYLINETAMHQLGWDTPEEAIGQKINWSIGEMALAYGPIVGIVKDFHQETLKNTVDPVVMVNEPMWLRTFLIKIKAQDMPGSVEKIGQTWNELFPSYPMEYFFLDDLYNNLYKGERVQIQLLFVFGALAIMIAFIGLVGLIAYALKTRTKEMAVRKVLGATLPDLIRLMSYEYLLVLFIGAILAVPLSIYGLNEWLSGFAYHVNISPLSYALTLMLIVLLLIVTVSLQTFKAAGVNPAETLRNE